MDIEKYLKARGKGKVTLLKENGTAFFDFQKFDPDTGEMIQPERLTVSLDILKHQVLDLQDQIQILAEVQELVGNLLDS